jgi:hypothetical protein
MFSIPYMICILRINSTSGIGISGMIGIAGRCLSVINVQLLSFSTFASSYVFR